MNLRGAKTVYTVLPNWPGNRSAAKEERIEFDLEGVSQPEKDELELRKNIHYTDKDPVEAGRLCVLEVRDVVRRKFKGVRGLVVDGTPIRDFDDFYDRAPSALVNWVFGAVWDDFTLQAAEAKNFEPPSDSASGNRPVAIITTAAPAAT